MSYGSKLYRPPTNHHLPAVQQKPYRKSLSEQKILEHFLERKNKSQENGPLAEEEEKEKKQKNDNTKSASDLEQERRQEGGGTKWEPPKSAERRETSNKQPGLPSRGTQSSELPGENYGWPFSICGASRFPPRDDKVYHPPPLPRPPLLPCPSPQHPQLTYCPISRVKCKPEYRVI